MTPAEIKNEAMKNMRASYDYEAYSKIPTANSSTLGATDEYFYPSNSNGFGQTQPVVAPTALPGASMKKRPGSYGMKEKPTLGSLPQIDHDRQRKKLKEIMKNDES